MQGSPLLGKLPYHGGNGPLFSLLLSMLESCDAGHISHGMFGLIVRNWGEHLGKQMPLSGELEHDLDMTAALLRTMGFVRVFEPHEPTDDSSGPTQILVMRCLFSRYVNKARVKEESKANRILPLFVDGILRAGNHGVRVEVAPGPFLRPDEYILSLRPAAASSRPNIVAPGEPKATPAPDNVGPSQAAKGAPPPPPKRTATGSLVRTNENS